MIFWWIVRIALWALAGYVAGACLVIYLARLLLPRIKR